MKNIANYFGSSENSGVNCKPIILQLCLVYSGLSLFVSMSTNFPHILTNDIQCQIPAVLKENKEFYRDLCRLKNLYTPASEVSDTILLSYFSFLPFMSFFVCVTYLTPWLHDTIENGCLKKVLEEPKIGNDKEKEKKIMKDLYGFVKGSGHFRSHFALSFVFECLQLWILVFQYILLDVWLNSGFHSLGVRYFLYSTSLSDDYPNPLPQQFPQVAACNVTLHGTGGREMVKNYVSKL